MKSKLIYLADTLQLFRKYSSNSTKYFLKSAIIVKKQKKDRIFVGIIKINEKI